MHGFGGKTLRIETAQKVRHRREKSIQIFLQGKIESFGLDCMAHDRCQRHFQ
jgi:hypothetical protein